MDYSALKPRRAWSGGSVYDDLSFSVASLPFSLDT